MKTFQSACLMFFVFLFISTTAAADILVHDPLVGSTLGTQIGGGVFLGPPSAGWQSTGGKIVYDAGKWISNGYFEAKMRGWTAPAQGTDKSHPLAGWESKDKYSHHLEPGSFWNWRIGTGYNPFKVLATPRGLGLREEARVGSNAKVNAGQPSTWHTYRVEWKKGIVKFFFNGDLLHTFTFAMFNMRYFTIGKDDQYGLTNPAPIISDVYIVEQSPTIPVPTPTPTSGFYFSLCSGMNLISNVYQSTKTNSSSGLLKNICSGNADIIWQYDCTGKSFRSWTALDIGSGWSAWPGMPFWVNISNPAGCVWIPEGVLLKGINYSLCKGLNMVAIPVYTTSISKASDLLKVIPGCMAVYRWKKEQDCARAQGFDSYFSISSAGDDYTVLPGHAYWVSVADSTVWTPPDP